ncbi:MAG: hypothetical protein FD153_999 [Rhodospirillaceae bacterium]|nr:MAG: hypothetical protein FD153_999 [Rhodospirillaceae bacterium]
MEGFGNGLIKHVTLAAYFMQFCNKLLMFSFTTTTLRIVTRIHQLFFFREVIDSIFDNGVSNLSYAIIFQATI